MKIIKNISQLFIYIASLISTFYLFAITPKLFHKKKLSEFKNWDYAHRGLHNKEKGIPENSMTAFKHAVDNGFGIELDVHATVDDQLVIMHDNSLIRMCHVDLDCSDVLYEQIKDLTIQGTHEKIPTLEEVLKLVDGQVPLIIELKVDKNNYARLSSLVHHALRDYTGLYCIESFHPMVLHWFKRHSKSTIRGQLSCNFYREKAHCDIVLFLMTHLMSNFLTRPDFIAYKYSDTNMLSYKINKNLFNTATAVWTVSTPEAYRKHKKSLDMVIFEGFSPRINNLT